MTLDVAGLRHLAGAHPDLAERIPRIMRAMTEAGHPLRLTSGRRSAKEQARLYAQGRTTPGDRVTSRDGVAKRSKHQEQQDGTHWAVDVCFLLPGGGVSWDGPWDHLGALVRSEGLSWGGDFAVIKDGKRVARPDRPHIEVKG